MNCIEQRFGIISICKGSWFLIDCAVLRSVNGMPTKCYLFETHLDVTVPESATGLQG